MYVHTSLCVLHQHLVSILSCRSDANSGHPVEIVLESRTYMTIAINWGSVSKCAYHQSPTI